MAFADIRICIRPNSADALFGTALMLAGRGATLAAVTGR